MATYACCSRILLLEGPGSSYVYHVYVQEEMKGTIDGELATVISSVSLACKQIASLVNRAGVSNLTGLAGAANVQVRSASIVKCM